MLSPTHPEYFGDVDPTTTGHHPTIDFRAQCSILRGRGREAGWLGRRFEAGLGTRDQRNRSPDQGSAARGDNGRVPGRKISRTETGQGLGSDAQSETPLLVRGARSDR